MFRALDLMLGESGIPEGFPVAIGKELDLHLNPVTYWSVDLEMDYWFFLQEVRAKWIQQTGEGTGYTIALEMFRDRGDRAYQQGNLGDNAIDLRTLTTPAEYVRSGPPTSFLRNNINVRPNVPLNMWFPPGSVLKFKVSGYVVAEPDVMDLVAIGRYVLRPGVE